MQSFGREGGRAVAIRADQHDLVAVRQERSGYPGTVLLSRKPIWLKDHLVKRKPQQSSLIQLLQGAAAGFVLGNQSETFTKVIVQKPCLAADARLGDHLADQACLECRPVEVEEKAGIVAGLRLEAHLDQVVAHGWKRFERLEQQVAELQFLAA